MGVSEFGWISERMVGVTPPKGQVQRRLLVRRSHWGYKVRSEETFLVELLPSPLLCHGWAVLHNEGDT